MTIRALSFGAPALALALTALTASAGDCGDLNDDRFVDIGDFLLLGGCLGGPDLFVPPECFGADFDQDSDVDLADFAEFAERFYAYPGALPDCVPPPYVTANPPCTMETGPSVELLVEAPTWATGSVCVRVYEEDDDGGLLGTPVFEDCQTLDGSPTYVFTVAPPPPGMYNATAQLLNDVVEQVGMGGAHFGVRPDYPWDLPEEICTHKFFPLSAASLRPEVDEAVQNQTPMTLEIGTRTFVVLLESNDEIIAPEILQEHPDVALFRGVVVGDPDSEVRLTFSSDIVQGVVDVGIGTSSEYSVYLEPSLIHDPNAPPEQYIGYVSHHANFEWPEHEDPVPPQEAGRAVAGPASTGRLDHIHVNLYRDYDDPSITRFDDFNRLDATFYKRLARHVFMVRSVQINTNAYRDPPNLLDDFTADANVTLSGAHVALLFSNNPANINYGTTLGTAWWVRGGYAGNSACCWVKNTGSAKKKRLVACHEISHNLGASDTDSGHRNGHIRSKTYGVGLLTWTVYYYSIMKRPYKGDDLMDDNWFDSDQTTIRTTMDGLIEP